MSHPLVSRSPDLQRLVGDGFDVVIENNYLLVNHVPYVTAEKAVAYGTIASEISTAGETTARPTNHVVWFCGGVPHTNGGAPIDKIINSYETRQISNDLVSCCTFSSKPDNGYTDYYDKMTAYVKMVAGFAQVIDPDATPHTFPPITPDVDESMFQYLDSASSRAGISAISQKLEVPAVAIVGLGGTGAYTLEFVSKTPVKEIHLFDKDVLFTHNAFRSPGAATIDELNASPRKVDYFKARYSAMHRGIVTHPYNITEANVNELSAMSFVFLTMDTGSEQQGVVKYLAEQHIPFIDCGMGIYETYDTLAGIVRTTLCTPEQRQHVIEGKRIPFTDVEDIYDRNIQVADLNALNAVLAVIKWKKFLSFYADYEHEHNSTYTINGNHMTNTDQP